MRGLSFQQYALLHHLMTEGKPVSSGDFRRHLEENGVTVTFSGLASTLNNMEKVGLVKKKMQSADQEKGERRDPNYWSPTKKGIEVFKASRRLLVKKKTAEKA